MSQTTKTQSRWKRPGGCGVASATNRMSTLYVGGKGSKLPSYINGHHLREHFSEFEEHIERAIVMRDGDQKSKGFGMIKFDTNQAATRALNKLKGNKLQGKIPLNISYWHQKESSSSDTYSLPSVSEYDSESSEESDFDISEESDNEASTEQCTLYVTVNKSKFPNHINTRHLRKHFSDYQQDIVKAIIVRDRETKKTKGYGFVTFSTQAAAKAAQKSLNGSMLLGKFELFISIKKQQASAVSSSPSPDKLFSKEHEAVVKPIKTTVVGARLTPAKQSAHSQVFDKTSARFKGVHQDVTVDENTEAYYQWYYTDDSNQLVPYLKRDSDKIESSYRSSSKISVRRTLVLTIEQRQYHFDFPNMEQINSSTRHRRAIERKQVYPAASRQVQWYYQDDSEQFAPYTAIASTKIERMFRGEITTQTLIIQSRVYMLDFSIMKQINSVTGRRRIIKREVLRPQKVAPKIEESLYPSEWQQQHEKENCRVCKLSVSSAEYRSLESKFKETMPSAEITSIKRIQNKWLWDRYRQTKERLHKKNAGRVNERELFHGSRQVKAETIYSSEEGFESRFSSEGMWGQANYFAEKASYSSDYAFTLPNGKSELLLAKVLTGDSYECAPDRKLRLPPEKVPSKKDSIKLKQVRYDTVTGETCGSRVYMTYQNDRAYPAYVIVYTNTLRAASFSQTPPAAQSYSQTPQPAVHVRINTVRTTSSPTPAAKVSSHTKKPSGGGRGGGRSRRRRGGRGSGTDGGGRASSASVHSYTLPSTALPQYSLGYPSASYTQFMDMTSFTDSFTDTFKDLNDWTL